LIHVRLKNELKRLGVKPAEEAKVIGEPDSQGLRDVLGGRKRLTAEMLAALEKTGVRVLYVLFDDSVPPPPEVISPDERYLLERYRGSTQALKDAALSVLLSGGQSTAKKSKQITVTANGGQAAGRDIIRTNKTIKHGN